MKLLVLAQTPPPVHGQSLAAGALLDFLRTEPDMEVHHVELRLSRSSTDIGRWRLGKVFTVLGACLRVWGVFIRHGRMPLYYIPAPGKRGALYRDWLVMLLCRPFATGLVLHWHAVGLGDWLSTRATIMERWVTRLALGRAALALVQAEALQEDAAQLTPRRCVVARNGVPDPVPDFTARSEMKTPVNVVFAGLGCAEKGLFDALEGILRANAGEAGAPAFRFTAMGPFASAEDEAEFRARIAAAAPEGVAWHLGFVSEAERNRVLREADIFCFPSYYPHEGQPAVLLEALALDLPIITTRWRGIPENLPTEHVYFVNPRAPLEIAAQLHAARRAGAPRGASRAHYLAHFTRARHHAVVLAALRRL